MLFSCSMTNMCPLWCVENDVHLNVVMNRATKQKQQNAIRPPSFLYALPLRSRTIAFNIGVECKKTSNGTEYRGKAATTADGKTCEPWTETEKTSHPDSGLEGFPCLSCLCCMPVNSVCFLCFLPF